MDRGDDSARRRDAQRVVDALTDLFDSVPPGDRPGAEEELRAAGIDPDRTGQRFARLAAAAASHGTGPAAQGTTRAHDWVQRGARPGRRGRRYVELAGALAATLLLCWAVWQARPQPIERRLARPAALPTLPVRAAAPGSERPPPGADSARLAAEAAPATLPAGRRAADGSGAPANAGARAAAARAHDGRADDRLAEERSAAAGAAAAGGEAWMLDRDTWQDADQLLPEPVLERVRSGDYRFTVQPLAANAFARHYPAAFWAASRANLSRYEVGADACALRELGNTHWPTSLFGLPFPIVDAQAATAACEIMWNVEATTGLAGGQDAALTFDEFATEAAPTRRLELSLRTTAFLGRVDPLDNPDDARSNQLVRVTAPASLTATAVMTRRWNDPNKRDSVWTYLPTLRRVRAVSAANRSDGLLGSSLPLDGFGCFDGKLEDFDWRVVGRQSVLAPMTGIAAFVQADQSVTRAEVNMPAARAVFEQADQSGAPWLVVQDLLLVPRDVWVVEATPRDKYYLAGRLVLFVDATLYRPYWLLAYSWQGELLGDTMCAQRWSRSADRAAAAATASPMTSVDDAHSRATLARYTALTLDRGQPEYTLFTIESLTAR